VFDAYPTGPGQLNAQFAPTYSGFTITGGAGSWGCASGTWDDINVGDGYYNATLTTCGRLCATEEE